MGKIAADIHLHTDFSSDSTASLKSMAEQAALIGLETICFTDHYDMDFPGGDFRLQTQKYMETVFELKDSFRDRLEILFGVELGMQTYLSERIREYIRQYPFDYCIGSVHLLDGKDPYCRDQYDLSDDEMLRAYLECTLENLRVIPDVQSLGHLDYVVRYTGIAQTGYSLAEYRELIEPVLKLLIERGIALELNTAGMKKGIGKPNPPVEVLRLYKELGGEMVTVGSDAHRPEFVGYRFPEAAEILENAGFAYYTVFRNKKPEMRPL